MANIFYRLLAEIFGRNPKKPKSNGIISSIELKKIIPIGGKTKGIIYLNDPGDSNKHLTDKKYNLCSFQQIFDFLLYDNVSFQKYRDRINDCDNFAIQLAGRLNEAFPGFAVGYAQSSTHAFNIFVDDKKRVWIIEPQTDEVFEYKNVESKYKINMVLI